MSKSSTFLNKEITKIKKLQGEIIVILEKELLQESNQIKKLEPFLITSSRDKKEDNDKKLASFKEKVIEIMTYTQKLNTQTTNRRKIWLILVAFGLCVLLGKYIASAKDNIQNRESGGENEFFDNLIFHTGIGACLSLVIFIYLSDVFEKKKAMTTAIDNFQSKISKVIILLQELEKSGENLSFYHDLCLGHTSIASLEDINKIIAHNPLRRVPDDIFEDVKIKPRILSPFITKKNFPTPQILTTDVSVDENKKEEPFSPVSTNTDELKTLSVIEKKPTGKINRKKEEISNKVRRIVDCLPSSTSIMHAQGRNDRLMIKMPIRELQEKLSRLEGVVVERSHNERSLRITFSDSIEIRIICRSEKISKKRRDQAALTKDTMPQKEVAEPVLSPKEKFLNIKDSKHEKIKSTLKETGQSEPPPTIRKPLTSRITHALIQAIAHKLKTLTHKPYRFPDNPQSKTYLLLTKFIQLSYPIHAEHKQGIIRAFGGVWRSLLMEEEPKDIDIALVIPSTLNPEKELFEPLKQAGIISDYKQSPQQEVKLYTVAFLNTIHEITILTEPSIDISSRTLDFNCNLFALEIHQFDPPLIQFYAPLNSYQFLLDIKNKVKPTVTAVINLEYLRLLKITPLKNQVVNMIHFVFPGWTPRLIHAVIQELQKSPHHYSLIKPIGLVFFILKLLSFLYDPKRLFRLLSLCQSDRYQLDSDLHIILYLNPFLLQAALSIKEKPYSNFTKSTLLYYFGEYIIKNMRYRIAYSPLISDMELAKTILSAGIDFSKKTREKINDLFEKAYFIYRDPQISGYLFDRLHSIEKNNQKSKVMDYFLVAIHLTKIHSLFTTIHTTHPDSSTFLQLYLLPVFKKQLTETARILQYTLNISINIEELGQILLSKWHEYRFGESYFDQHSLTRYTDSSHQDFFSSSVVKPKEKTEKMISQKTTDSMISHA